jgi:ketosteroid isomerase-like protein
MPEDRLAVVRAIHDAWLAGEDADRWMAPEVEYVNPDYAVEPGTVRGAKAFRRVYETWADFRFEPERFLLAGEQNVVVIGTAYTDPAATVAVQGRLAYVWTVRDGRAIRFQWFRQVAEALTAAGLPASAAS